VLGATWLPRIVYWFVDVHLDDGVNSDPEEEEKDITGQVQGLYAAAQDGMCSSHQVLMTDFGVSLLLMTTRTSKTFGKPSDGPADNGADLAVMIASRSTLLDSMSKGFIAKKQTQVGD